MEEKLRGLGIFAWFGYDLPIENRLRLIKNAGFDATALWWGGNDKEPDLARKIGLEIDNIHTPFNNNTSIWFDGLDGEDYRDRLISCVEDCHTHGISTAVIHIHLTPFMMGNIGAVNWNLGLKRIAKIVDAAESRNIRLAFENLTLLEPLNAVFERFPSKYAGFCYDSGHENLHGAPNDCLALYGDKLFALHLHDNFGDTDAHTLPFDGNINWEEKMKKLRKCNNVDYLTLEVDFLHNRHIQNTIYKDMYKNLSAEEYLNSAYDRAVKLRYWFTGKIQNL